MGRCKELLSEQKIQILAFIMGCSVPRLTIEGIPETLPASQILLLLLLLAS